MKSTPRLGCALRLRRLKSGIQLLDMAAYLGISAPYLYDLEFGHRRLTNARRKEYVAALRCLKPATLSAT